MCGLVGLAGKIGVNEERAFKTLLNLDTIRGHHSTGVAFVAPTGKVKVHKHLGTPWDLYDHAPFKNRWRLTHNVLIGHNRYATKGGINKNGAHPFEFESVVGCHNGTLTKQYLLDDSQQFDVDSENIYHHMDLNGVADTVENLAGAFALVWYNKEDETLNFIRNNQRPLFYCYSEDRKTVFWASEVWMLIAALGRENIKHQEVQEVKELHHYSFQVPLGNIAQAEPFGKIHVRKMQGYVDPFQKSSGGHYGGRPQGQQQLPPSNTKGKAANQDEKKEEPELRPFLNKDIEFYPLSISKPAKDTYFVRGALVGSDVTVDVRCHCYNRKEVWSELTDGISNHTKFRGFVKAFQDKDERYLLLDNRSIEAVQEEDYEEDKVEDLYTIQNGVMVSGKEFDEKTKQGCAWCSSPVTRDDAPSLRWIENDEFICEGCVDQPEVKEFLPQLH